MTNTFREHLQRAIFDTFELWDIWSEWWGNMTWPTKRQQRRQTQWQWQKFRVWPLIHCYESDSSRPNWWGLTKFHNFRQISQFWPISQFQPNFTILEYLKYLEYLELGQFRNFCDVFFFSKIRLLRYSIKYLVVFFNPTSYILNLNLHHILQLKHCLENLNSKVTNLSISLHARKQSTLIQGSPINSGSQSPREPREPVDPPSLP